MGGLLPGGTQPWHRLDEKKSNHYSQLQLNRCLHDRNPLLVQMEDKYASRSIVEAGNSGKFLLKPVIRTVAFAETGAIEGNIVPAESLPWVYAIAGTDTVAGTRANVEGEFRLVGLLPASYTLAINPTDENFLDTELPDVEVIASDTTDVGTIDLNE